MTAPITTATAPPAGAVFPKKHYLNDGTTRPVVAADPSTTSGSPSCTWSRCCIALFLGGIFAMVIRLELLTPGPTIIEALTYNRMFTLHGVVMIFLFMIPAIPGVFGNFFLPIMLGAKDVAFPRLNLLSLLRVPGGRRR